MDDEVFRPEKFLSCEQCVLRSLVLYSCLVQLLILRCGSSALSADNTVRLDPETIDYAGLLKVIFC
jgi:hypothetical protein